MSDLIEAIGRVHDAYRGLGAVPTVLVVSPEAEYELRRLVGTRDLHRLRVGGMDLPLEVDRQMIGADAWKIRTSAGYVTPEMARARHFASR